MPITRVEKQVTWSSGANAKLVDPASSAESDVITLADECFAARIQCKADNSGTPNAADIIYVSVLESMGDPDGSGADEFVTPENGHPLAVLDTFAADPSIEPAPFPTPQKSFKIYAEGITATTVNGIVVSATIIEHRST